MKIFKMNDYDWWMDVDLESAEINYLKYLAEITDPCADDFKDAVELTEEELDNHRFYKDDDYRDNEDGNPKCSFREHMEELKQVPQFFASTEY